MVVREDVWGGHFSQNFHRLIDQLVVNPFSGIGFSKLHSVKALGRTDNGRRRRLRL